jgi:hypothetical protein
MSGLRNALLLLLMLLLVMVQDRGECGGGAGRTRQTHPEQVQVVVASEDGLIHGPHPMDGAIDQIKAAMGVVMGAPRRERHLVENYRLGG